MPGFTTIVGVDDAHLEEWRCTWPTWRANRPLLLEQPLLVVCDGAREESWWRRQLAFLEHPQLEFLGWNLSGVDQREKMLTGLVWAARQVKTSWYLKLDVDVVAEPQVDWFQEAWFQPDAQGRAPVFVASPWRYTKPGSWIGKLEEWAAHVPELNAFPRLNPPLPAANGKLRHQRIISYCFFGDTRWTAAMASLCDSGRLPVPSHDTYLWYCAARRQEFFRTVRMAELGWRHLSRRHLPAAAVAALKSSESSGASSSEAAITDHAGELIRLAQSLRSSTGVLRGAEIGVALGETSAALLKSLTDLELTMVDSWATYPPSHQYRLSGDGCAGLTEAQQTERLQQATRGTDFAAQRRTIVRSESLAAAAQLPDSGLDFAFIDADHTYEAVRRDIAAWWPKVRDGGVLCGHDYQSPRDRRGVWGVSRAVDEFVAEKNVSVSVGKGGVWQIRKEARIRTRIRDKQGSINSNLPLSADEYADCGVAYLLTGPAHAVRLVVSLASLRKYWGGPVTVFTTQPLSDEVGRLCAQDERLRVEHRTWNAAPVRRNASYLTKVTLASRLPYPRTLCLDCDTLICGDISPLLDGLKRVPLCVTQFAKWTTGKRVMRRRIERWRQIPLRRLAAARRDELITGALHPYPSINTGVYALRQGSALAKEWLALATAGRSTFICDEIALQMLLPEQPHEVLDCRFNCSPIYAAETSDARIWHFHGEKHLKHRSGRRLWLPEFQRCLESGLAALPRWAHAFDSDVGKFAVTEAVAV